MKWRCVSMMLAMAGCSRSQASRPPSPELRALRASAPLLIDGKLAEPEWLKAPTTAAWLDASEPSRVVAHTAARVVFDDQALVVGLYMADEDIDSADHVDVAIGDQRWELSPDAPLRGPAGVTGAIDFDGTANDARDDDEEWAAELRVPWAVLGLNGPPAELPVVFTRNDTPRGVPERHLLWRGVLHLRDAAKK